MSLADLSALEDAGLVALHSSSPGHSADLVSTAYINRFPPKVEVTEVKSLTTGVYDFKPHKNIPLQLTLLLICQEQKKTNVIPKKKKTPNEIRWFFSQRSGTLYCA